MTSLAITVLGYQSILTGQMWSRGPAEGLRLEKQEINRLLAAVAATLARFLATSKTFFFILIFLLSVTKVI